MKEIVIGDTPAQLGQIKAASAMMIDGKVVTKADYLALAAQVEVLRRELQSAADWFSAYWPYHQEHCDRVKQMDAVAKSTPAACLAQVRAEAVEAFALQVSDTMDDGIDRAKLIILASEYVSNIRQGVK